MVTPTAVYAAVGVTMPEPSRKAANGLERHAADGRL